MSAPADPEVPDRRRRRRLKLRRGSRVRRPIRARFDLRKAMFVLPNLFTVSSIFCGFYAITLCFDDPDALTLRRAALAIFFGMFFDMFDGRVARLTRTQSEFGMQLDSLADAISFGAAPAVLMYRWSLSELGFVGLIGAFLFVACGALRLARFNVLAARETSGGGGKYFTGLPIPLAAGTVVAAVLATFPYERGDGGALKVVFDGETQLVIAPVVALVGAIVLALLMVSTVRYQTFKKVRPNRRSLSVALTVTLGFVLVTMISSAAIALAVMFLLYIAYGLFDALVVWIRRPGGAEGSEPPAAPNPPPTDESPAKSP